MIRIGIAEDHAIVRGGLKHMFSIIEGLQVVAEADNGAQVLRIVRECEMDLLLMDLNMPGISGPDLIKRVKTHKPGLPILVLSMNNTAQIASLAFKAGADGYITKDSDPEILVEGINKVASGRKFIAPEMAQKMALLDTSHDQAIAHHALSGREMEVFTLLLKGLSVNDIAEKLSISNKTVSTHKTRVHEKLQAPTMADLMRYAMAHQLLD